MNVEIETEAAQFLIWEYINSNFFAVCTKIGLIIYGLIMSCGRFPVISITSVITCGWCEQHSAYYCIVHCVLLFAWGWGIFLNYCVGTSYHFDVFEPLSQAARMSNSTYTVLHCKAETANHSLKKRHLLMKACAGLGVRSMTSLYSCSEGIDLSSGDSSPELRY